jgi:hypothetical protein
MTPASRPAPGAGGLRWLAAGVAGGSLAAAAFVVLAVSVLGPSGGGATRPPRFVDESAAGGVRHVYDGEFPFFVGGGVAVFDCDDDGRQDVYVAGGANPARLYRNQSDAGGPLSFSEVPSPAAGLTEVTGGYPIDIDGDGHADLVVLRLGENVVLRGLGDCTFERANERWSIDGGDSWTAAFSAKWEGDAASPTLAFGNYAVLTETGQASGACSDNVLIRPAADGMGYSDPVLLSPGWCTLSILFSDWDRSGRRDLRMTNDRHYYRDGEEQLWRVPDGGAPRLYTRDDGWQRMQIWGMGIASHDLTGDGLPEVFLTSQGDNKLQALLGGGDRPQYGDIALDRGVTAHRPFAGSDVMPSTAWHPEFQDVNNDTFIDLFITKGNVDEMPEFAAADPSNLLLGRSDGTFAESADAAGILSFARARGAALADFNGDGLLDLIVVNRRENVSLWRNVGAGDAASPAAIGSWLGVSLRQDGPNRDAIGSWIEVRVAGRTMLSEVTVGGGHAGGRLGPVHFGLGDADRAEVRVVWPDGEQGPWLDVVADQYLVVERGASQVLSGVS